MGDDTAESRGLLEKGARVAFAFVVMNASAVAGLVAFLLVQKVWRREP